MGLNFSFATASQIIFGNNSIEKVPELISKFGKKILLVTGQNSDRSLSLINNFSSNVEISASE